MQANKEGQPIRVLLVEDEFLISEWVAGTLLDLGFAVHAVGNATEALRHLATAPVDVLFTDVQLPGGTDGTSLAQRARELIPDLPVVYASAALDVRAFEARVPGSIFVAKPYDPTAVGRILASVAKTATARVAA